MVKTAEGNQISLLGSLKKGGVLVIGVFHGDEPQGKYLTEKYLEEFPDTNISFIPCLNPDGMKKNTRVNSNGVDINRNFPCKNWAKTEKNEFFGGEKPASETETRFAVDTVERLSPKLILTLHAPYKIVNYDGDAEEISKKISELTGYRVEPSIGYPTPGSFGTWAGIERKIPVITLELDEEAELEELKEPVFKVFKMLEEY